MSDLFNNPMVNNALKSMTPEQIDDYKKKGEQMYGTVNFPDSTIINNLAPPMEESAAYIEAGIKSGLSPRDLTEDEIVLLTQAFGEEWYLRYGFTKDEVPEPGLSVDVKESIEKAIQHKIDQENAQQAKKKKRQDRKDAKKNKKK